MKSPECLVFLCVQCKSQLSQRKGLVLYGRSRTHGFVSTLLPCPADPFAMLRCIMDAGQWDGPDAKSLDGATLLVGV